MTRLVNPDIYQRLEVPVGLKPYVRRVLVADTAKQVDMMVDVRATGYHYFGWIWRGSWQAHVSEEMLFDSDKDGSFHFTGQVGQREITVRLQRDIGQIFLEFTALGHFQVFGISGASMMEAAVAPQAVNPTLKPYLDRLKRVDNSSASARLSGLAAALVRMPKHAVPDEISAAIGQMETVDGDISISGLVKNLAISERKFRTDFKHLVGLSPKAFCNTLRINWALNQLLTRNGSDLARIAVETGFSDQAHFTRAFSQHLGNAPRKYFQDIENTLARFVGQSCQNSAKSLNKS